MHISLIVHANWLKDGRVIHAERLRQLLDDQMKLAIPNVTIAVATALDAHKRCSDDEHLTTVRVKGMPPSGDLQDGFSLADKAENVVKNFMPADDEWAWLP
jgi:hypothetical protein